MGCCKEKKKLRGVNKLKSILAGWSNVLWSSDEVKQIAIERAEICSECDKNKHTFCTDCGCWIPAKARSLDEVCDKWGEVDKKYNL